MLLQEVVANQLLSIWRWTMPTSRDEGDPSQTALSRARDYIHSHLADPITVGDIAAAAGIGVRALQTAFRRDMGESPVTYLLNQRLDCVNRDLRARSNRHQPVSQIAYRWGFFHLSDFSRRYRKRFGRTPSETRRETFGSSD